MGWRIHGDRTISGDELKIKNKICHFSNQSNLKREGAPTCTYLRPCLVASFIICRACLQLPLNSALMNFQYLESYISKEGDAEVDVRARIGKAASVFQRLRPIWKSGAINRNLKLRLYSSIVLPTAIYARDTWKRTS